MSPATGLELDFGGGLNSLLADGNINANGGADFGGPSNGDFFSTLFDSAGAMSMSMSGSGNSNTNSTNATTAWQKQKTLLDPSQQQQQQDQQNSLNALLSQHNGNSNANNTNNSSSTTPNPFGFATREDLETLSFNAAAAANSQQQQQQATLSFAQQQQGSNANATTNANNNNLMFVATIVDPSQEDAPPQQMLFLPGSNQVIPMPTGNNGAMMALANLPVIFPQATSNNNNSATANSWLNNHHHQQQQTNQQQQQPQGLLTFNGSANATNSAAMNLNSLEDVFGSATNSTPTPLELATLGLTTSNVDHHQQQFKTTPEAPKPAAAASMPIRPLSAYNFFFSDERERILHNRSDDKDVFDSAKKQRLLLAHLAKDRTKRRPHRKTHGKINFTTLSKLIGQRWKQLPDDRKNFYREVAAIDLERYQRELRERSPAAGSGNGALDGL